MMWKKQNICAAGSIAALYALLHIANIGCPIKFLTGISCAGCGMTRAWLSILKLNFAEAFWFHPLFWLVPFGMIFLLCRKRIPEKAARFIVSGLIIIFMTVYVIRMLNPKDTVVNIDFCNSAVWHILERAKGILYKMHRVMV